MKKYKRFTAHLKKNYGAPSLTAAEAKFERFRTAWIAYPGTVDAWVRNWVHVAQLFNYGSAVRKVRVTELYQKWGGLPTPNWAKVRNQLTMDDKIHDRFLKFENS